MLGIKDLGIAKGIKKLFGFLSKKVNAPVSVSSPLPEAVSVADQKPDSSYIELGMTDLESDWIIISDEEAQSVSAAASLRNVGLECEHLSKVAAYKLAIPLDQNADAALATQKDLSNRGYALSDLGSFEQRKSNGIFVYAVVKEDTEEPITIVCRGTQGDASVIADLDIQGPGATAIEEMKDIFLNQINELAIKYPHRKIRFSGHSLGGSIAQILTAKVLEETRSAMEDAALASYPAMKNIKGIETVIFQSAWVNDSIANTAQENAERLKMIDPNFEINFFAHIKSGDFVSRTGGYLFSDIDPETVNVSLDMRKLDKSCVTLADVMEIGFVAAATAIDPVVTGLTIGRVVSARFLSNRIEAHSDFFYLDRKDRTYKTDLSQHYGIMTNMAPVERKRIKHIFDKNDRQYIPYQKDIAASAFALLNPLSTSDLHAAGACVRAVAFLTPVAVDVLSMSPSFLPAYAVQKGATIAENVQALIENHEHCRRAIKKCYKA